MTFDDKLDPKQSMDYVLARHLKRFDPNQPRDPKGTSTGGRFASSGGQQLKVDPDNVPDISVDWSELPKNTYWRIQPKGLELAGHFSQDGGDAGTSDGVHVFYRVQDTIHPYDQNTFGETYGNEVVQIESNESHWDSGDVEGVVINPDASRIVARVDYEDFARLLLKTKNNQYDPDEWQTAWQQAADDDYDVEIDLRKLKDGKQ